MVHGYFPAFARKTPKTHTNFFKRVEERQRSRAHLFWKHYECLICKETIATGLRHSLAPVRQLALECTGAWVSYTDERLDIREPLIVNFFPCHHMQISNPVTIHWDLSGERQGSFSASRMNRRCLFNVGSHKGDRKSILCRSNSFPPWEVMAWFAEFQLWHKDSDVAHDYFRNLLIIKKPIQTTVPSP